MIARTRDLLRESLVTTTALILTVGQSGGTIPMSMRNPEAFESTTNAAAIRLDQLQIGTEGTEAMSREPLQPTSSITAIRDTDVARAAHLVMIPQIPSRQLAVPVRTEIDRARLPRPMSSARSFRAPRRLDMGVVGKRRTRILMQPCVTNPEIIVPHETQNMSGSRGRSAKRASAFASLNPRARFGSYNSIHPTVHISMPRTSPSTKQRHCRCFKQ